MADEPTPKRTYQRFKRVVRLSVALLCAAAMAAYVAWGAWESSEVQRQVDRAHAAGEAITFGDVYLANLPADDNAAYHLAEALNAWPVVEDDKQIDQTLWFTNRAVEADPVADSSGYLWASRASLTSLERAGKASGCNWNAVIRRPLMQALDMDAGSDLRRLAWLADDAARRAHGLGNDRLAMRYLLAMTTIARATDGLPPRMMTHVDHVSIITLQADLVERLLPELHIDDQAPNAARPSQIRMLIAQLTDEEDARKRHHRGWVGERWIAYDAAMSMIEGYRPREPGEPDFKAKVAAFPLRPVLLSDLRQTMDVMGRVVDASRTTDSYPAFVAAAGRLPTWSELKMWRRPSSALTLPVIGEHMPYPFFADGERRMAAAALAIALYQHDHNGSRPDALAALTPDYLAAVPVDPFASDGRAIAYRPGESAMVAGGADVASKSRTRPAALYSVGLNGIDDGGSHPTDHASKLAMEQAVGSSGEEHTIAAADSAPTGADQTFLLDAVSHTLTPVTATAAVDPAGERTNVSR